MKRPRLFKAEIEERRFHRRILGRVYIDSERDYLLQLYSREADGRYRRSGELDGEDAKHLEELARSIKKNRGVVRTGRVSILAVLVAALLVFNFGFKNRLLERGLERALESVFAARAEVEQLECRILAGRLSFAHLSVADREQPLRNLFELGSTEVDLNTNQLLKGKAVLSDLVSRDIRWHTPRQSSGALSEDRDSEEEHEETADRRGFSLNLGGLDAKALIDDQIAKLSSPARIIELNYQLRDLEARWEDAVERSRSDVQELSGSIDAVRAIDVGSLDTLPELQQAVTDIQGAATAVNRVGEDLRAMDRQIKADRREIATAGQEFEEAIDADVAYLSSLTDLSSGELKTLVSDLAAGYLQQVLGRCYGYTQAARGYAERLLVQTRGKRRDREKVNRMQRGADVPFEMENYPRFLLQNAEVSLQSPSKTVEGSLQNLSSHPDLIDRPLIFSFLQTEGEKNLGVEGLLDSREQRDVDLDLEAQATGFSIQLSEGLEDLGLSSFAGKYRFRTRFTRTHSGKGAEGQGLLELYDLVLQPSSGQNQLGTVLYETLGSLSKVDVAFEYTMENAELARVSARSSADEQLARALEEHFAEISAQYQDRLRDELNARMAEQIRENEDLSRAFAELIRRSDGNLAEAAAYEAALAQKRVELEKQATDAVKSQLESQLEKLPLPKPKF